MEEKQKERKEKAPEEKRATSYGLLYIIRAYNRKEITLEEWLRQSREWAEQIISQYSTGKEA